MLETWGKKQNLLEIYLKTPLCILQCHHRPLWPNSKLNYTLCESKMLKEKYINSSSKNKLYHILQFQYVSQPLQFLMFMVRIVNKF